MFTSAPIPTLPAADLGRATAWYERVLGAEVDRKMPDGGVLYRIGDGLALVYPTAHAGTAKNTAATWFVDDVDAEVARLRGHGVTFSTFDLGGAGTWDGDIAVLGDGNRMSWFLDSEGNVLNVAQQPDD